NVIAARNGRDQVCVQFGNQTVCESQPHVLDCGWFGVSSKSGQTHYSCSSSDSYYEQLIFSAFGLAVLQIPFSGFAQTVGMLSSVHCVLLFPFISSCPFIYLTSVPVMLSQ